MFRRRRRPRVAWLPVPGTTLRQNAAGLGAAVLNNPAPAEFIVNTQPGLPTTISVPLVVDEPISATFVGSSLNTYRGSSLNLTQEFGYRLRRIVGDVYLAAGVTNDQATNPASVFVAAGIIVRNVDSTGQPSENPEGQDVGTIENQSDPYVWRRTWILGHSEANATATYGIIAKFPQTSADYGTKWHTAVDQKTARRVGPEERLFLTMTFWELPLNQQDIGGDVSTDDSPTVYVLTDLRVLGTIFTSAGNRRNASR